MSELYKKVETEFEIGVKRFYLPIDFDIECPHCKSKINRNFDDDYLSYPSVNKKETLYVYCDNCDKESEFDITIEIGIKADIKNIRKL